MKRSEVIKKLKDIRNNYDRVRKERMFHYKEFKRLQKEVKQMEKALLYLIGEL